MNWKDIKKKYPKAYEKSMSWWENKNGYATEKIWEEQYIPTEPQDDYIEKVAIIHQFASTLVNNIEDIPEDTLNTLKEMGWTFD